jgi:hypothetical protein
MRLIGLLLIVLLVSVTGLLSVYIYCGNLSASAKDKFFFGVSFGQETVEEAKLLIDKVKGYTNFFLINSLSVTTNETALNEVSEYAIKADLNFMVFFDMFINRRNATFRYPWQQTWLDTAKERYGDKFLGVHLFDEPSGKQIDNSTLRLRGILANESDYSDAANRFTASLSSRMEMQYLKNISIPVFTSDYALYWFDYLAGYDTVFVELGWNQNTAKHIALCRGAANVQSKDWGAIITWTYYEPPYLASGPEILEEMRMAYGAGAKYVVVFNYAEDAETGKPCCILKEEHFTAMQQFWGYVHHDPEHHGQIKGRMAFVLPKDYGWGMRRQDDNIWGLWPADEKAPLIWENANKLIQSYGLQLDIVYDDGLLPDNMYGYSKISYWNDPSLSLSSPPTPSPTPIENPSSSMDYVSAVAAVAVIAVVVAPVLMLRKRQYCITFDVTGVGRDFTSTVIVVDGESYDRYGTSFWWTSGSRHTFEFKSPIEVNHGKQYICTCATGLATNRNGILTVSMSGTLTGNYRPVFKTSVGMQKELGYMERRRIVKLF